jgi:hypothetical protein
VKKVVSKTDVAKVQAEVQGMDRALGRLTALANKHPFEGKGAKEFEQVFARGITMAADCMKMAKHHLDTAVNPIPPAQMPPQVRRARFCTYCEDNEPIWDGYTVNGAYPLFTLEQAQAILAHFEYTARYDSGTDILYYQGKDTDVDEEYAVKGFFTIFEGELFHLYFVGEQDSWSWEEVTEAQTALDRSCPWCKAPAELEREDIRIILDENAECSGSMYRCTKCGEVFYL